MVRIHHSLHLTLLRYVYRDGGNIEIVISLMDKTLSLRIFTYYFEGSSTYDHRTLKTRLPVRSALFKQRTGGSVIRWVTTSEYPLLYVFCTDNCFLSLYVFFNTAQRSESELCYDHSDRFANE